MKIPTRRITSETLRQLREQQVKPEDRSAGREVSPGAARQSDTVQVSLAQKIQDVFVTKKAERIEEIRKQIADGSYLGKLDKQLVASSLGHHLDMAVGDGKAMNLLSELAERGNEATGPKQ